MRYEGAIFRPFSEANSYLLQCTIGCSHNGCSFCGMYKEKRFRIRDLDEIRADIRMAKEQYGDVEKVFLCDGDAIAIPTAELLEILGLLFAAFPSLRHVGTYVGPRSILAKGLDELEALRAAGLTKAYLGVETGDDRLLKVVNKGVSADEMLRAGQNIVRAGMNLSSMVLLGLAGKGPQSIVHARATAAITNAMQPRYLAAMTLTPVPGTALYRQLSTGAFELPDPFEILAEMRALIEDLTLDGLRFVGVHVSNYLPLNGTLPRDKQTMLAQIDGILEQHDPRLLRPEHLRGL